MPLSRRSFLGSLAGGSLALLRGGSQLGKHIGGGGMQRSLAYVASDDPSKQGVHVFRVEGRRWHPVQFVASSAPSALALAPDGQSLFVANRVDNYRGLPAGSVESYGAEARSGRLSLLSRRALSLSATAPEHLAVSRDGRHLAVAATGGGLYNVFPLAEAGSLLPVGWVRKEIGSGPRAVHQASAHPSYVLFDSRDRLMAADLGADRVSVLHRRDGLLQMSSRVEVLPGAGPRIVALDRTESVVVVAGGLDRSIVTHRYDLAEGALVQCRSYVEVHGSATGHWSSLVAHPRRDLMLGSWKDGRVSGVVCWRVDPKTALLERQGELVQEAEFCGLTAPGDDDHSFVVLDKRGGRVHAVRCDPESGELRLEADLAEVPSPCAVAVRRCSEDASG